MRKRQRPIGPIAGLLGTSLLAGLCAMTTPSGWRAGARTNAEESIVQFEETQPAEIMGLGMFRDGVLPTQAGE